MRPQTAIDPETQHAAQLFLGRLEGQFDYAQAILFGSRARNSHRSDSDADVAVILRGDPQRFLPNKLALADVAFDVLLETGIRIQPFPVWEEGWQHPEDYPKPELLANIDREGIRFVSAHDG